MLPQIKLVLMLLFGLSFLSITSLLVASNDEHEGHDHSSHQVDAKENRIYADDEQHDDHDHGNIEKNTDSSGHDHHVHRY